MCAQTSRKSALFGSEPAKQCERADAAVPGSPQVLESPRDSPKVLEKYWRRASAVLACGWGSGVPQLRAAEGPTRSRH